MLIIKGSGSLAPRLLPFGVSCRYGCQPQLGPEWQLVLPDVNPTCSLTLYPAVLHGQRVNQLHFPRLMGR